MIEGNTMIEEKTLTVAELRELFYQDDLEIEIDTPDGYQKITSWWDKGVLPMVSVTTADGWSTTCATNHLLQRGSGEWMLAVELAEGDEILTESGLSIVIGIVDAGEEECFDFEVDHPNHRYWGDGLSSHNSGKSYIVSGNIVRNALEMGISVILMDTEGAIKKKWAEALGVNTEHPNLIRWSKSTINEVTKTVSDFMNDDYKPAYSNMAREEQPPVLFVLDSLGNLETDTGIEQFEKGDLKGDKGLFAKQSKAMLKNFIRVFDGYQVGLVFTNHTYVNQNQYSDHEDIVSGGRGQVFVSDILVNMNKSKLKEEVGKKKITLGIESTIKCSKSRFAKPFEEVDVLIPYETGMDPYSGLFEMFVKNGALVRDGNKWVYTNCESDKEIKKYEKEIKADREFMDMVMREYKEDPSVPLGVDETPEDADVE